MEVLYFYFKTTYEDKITTSNYSIDAKTTYKNKFLSCITKEEYSLNSKDRLIKENLKEELIKRANTNEEEFVSEDEVKWN